MPRITVSLPKPLYTETLDLLDDDDGEMPAFAGFCSTVFRGLRKASKATELVGGIPDGDSRIPLADIRKVKLEPDSTWKPSGERTSYVYRCGQRTSDALNLFCRITLVNMRRENERRGATGKVKASMRQILSETLQDAALRKVNDALEKELDAEDKAEYKSAEEDKPKSKPKRKPVSVKAEPKKAEKPEV